MENQQANSRIKNSDMGDPYAISKAQSDEYINAWQNDGYQIVPSSVNGSPTLLQLDSFLFSIEDFENFVTRVNKDPNSQNITGVVCRIGIKPNPIIGGTPTNVPCLIFEPVLNFSAPAPSLEPVPAGSVQPGTDDGDIIGLTSSATETARYDFAYPCPPTCAIPPTP